LYICGEELEPGSTGFYRLKVATMLDGSDLTIPLHVINGEGKGPTLGVMAGVHGTEYYQNRVIRRIVNETAPDEVSGTILAVPVANPLAFSHASRQSPRPPEETVDFANLNRNVMAHLSMVEGEVVLPETQFYFRRAPHVRATCGGYLVSYMEAEDVGIGRPTREVE